MAFRPLPADQPVTLDYLMRDYIEHLEHHLHQIGDLLADFAARPHRP
jgi:hypothetical protein